MKLLLINLLILISLSAQVTMESSNLPIVVINTNGQNIRDSYKITADMGIIDNGPGKRNYVIDSMNNYNGKIGIEHRGASSQNFPKKQYAVETRGETGENLNVSLLGLPEENDWILYAPYTDKSLIRNVLLYELSNQLGQYASRSRFCELVLNGEYRGVYVLLEKIKRDNNRVDISKLDSTEITGDDLTGGYIVKIDKSSGEENSAWVSSYPPVPGQSAIIIYQYHYPRPIDIIAEQRTYIKEYFDAFEDMMISWDYDAEYENWIDVPSFVDFFLLNEISKNVDGYRLSSFFYKDKDSNDALLHAGPVWDFNLAFGNANYYNGWTATGWQAEINRLSSFTFDYSKIPFYWERLMNDRDFVKKIVDRWQLLRLNAFSTDNINSSIDDKVLYLDESQQRNFTQWPILDQYVWPNYYIGGTYENEINELKRWITERVGWMDTMLLDSIPPDTIANLEILLSTDSTITISWDTGSDNNRISGYDVFVNGEKIRYSILNFSVIDGIEPFTDYQIEVKARDYAGNYSVGNPVLIAIITNIEKDEEQFPQRYQFHQNYPNPFNPATTIRYDLPVAGKVEINVYNILGEKVTSLVDELKPAGSYMYKWNAEDLSSGIYFFQLKAANYVSLKKGILIK